jgi:hypothetical protein
VIGDSMRVVVRNMSPGPLECADDDGYSHPVAVQGQSATVAGLRPGHHQVTFTLGEVGDAVAVRVILATLRLVDQGLVRITGQATVRRAG